MRKKIKETIKRRPQSWGGGRESIADILRTRERGSSDANVQTFYCKNLDFRKLRCVRTRKGGL